MSLECGARRKEGRNEGRRQRGKPTDQQTEQTDRPTEEPTEDAPRSSGIGLLFSSDGLNKLRSSTLGRIDRSKEERERGNHRYTQERTAREQEFYIPCRSWIVEISFLNSSMHVHVRISFAQKL